VFHVAKTRNTKPETQKYSAFFMKKLLLIAALALCGTAVKAEKKDTTAVDTFKFTILKQNKITPVKNQASTGTCWSFSTIGFFESELLRMGKPEVDLSEMILSIERGAGIGSPSFSRTRKWPDNASVAFCSASSNDLPAEMHPGKSGKFTP